MDQAGHRFNRERQPQDDSKDQDEATGGRYRQRTDQVAADRHGVVSLKLYIVTMPSGFTTPAGLLDAFMKPYREVVKWAVFPSLKI
jgi:hypothetical protein